MSASGNYMNWLAVTVLPAGGSSIAINEVLDVEPDLQTQQEMFWGDNNPFPKCIRNTMKSRSIKLIGGNIAALLTIPEDTACTVTATLCDAFNGVGSGAITITLVNACRAKLGIKAPNNKFGAAEVEFNAFGTITSGVQADPMTITVAA